MLSLIAFCTEDGGLMLSVAVVADGVFVCSHIQK